MINAQQLNELVEKIMTSLPAGLKALPGEIEKNVKAVLQQGLMKLDVVTREEFDLQAKTLQRTRERLMVLEDELEQLRRRLNQEDEPTRED